MASAKKDSVAKPETKAGVTVSPLTLKVTIGALVSLFALYAGWKIVWADINNHWRQESIQKAIDEKVASDIKASSVKAEVDIGSVRDKAAADLAAHKTSEARGNAWQAWYIQDFRAAAETQWYRQCLKETKGKECTDEKERADTAKDAAKSLKESASLISKEK